MIVCNLHRFLQFLLFEVFSRVDFLKKPLLCAPDAVAGSSATASSVSLLGRKKVQSGLIF